VCPQLFELHTDKFSLQDGQFGEYDENALTERVKYNIDLVLEQYWKFRPFELSEMTHQEEPWKLARNGVPLGIKSNNRIRKSDMLDYYAGLIADEQE
jgi:uncharacterized phage-associated protein